MSGRHVVIPIFIPHEGCPFDCIFCNQKKISGRKEQMSTDAMKHIIESHLETVRPGTTIEIGFYGGSFTGIDRRQQLSFLAAAFEYVKAGAISSIRLSTRPDYINEEILDYLEKYGVMLIELGVQSLDDGVLLASGRGHTAADVFTASELIHEKGFQLGIQTMVGLPGDTREKDLATADKVIRLKPEVIRIYPVLVIRETYLEKLFKEGSYIPPSLDEAVDICSELLEKYEKSGLKVIRIGLQSSEDISEGSEVVAGPVHPAFRQLVESRLALRRIEKALDSFDMNFIHKVAIKTGKSNISNITGQKRSNIKFLREKYPGLQIEITACEDYGREIRIVPVR